MAPKTKCQGRLSTGKATTSAKASTAVKTTAAAKKTAAVKPKTGAKAASRGKTSSSVGSVSIPLNDLPESKGLKDAVFVLTGELDSMTRDDVVNKIKAAGGKVMSAVSGNTDFLIVGSHLDDGRAVEETSKYRKYLQLKENRTKFPQVLREAELLELLRMGAPSASAGASARPVVVRQDAAVLTPTQVSEQWVNRHAPSKLDELIGNAGAVKKLSTWLHDWDDVVLRGRTKVAQFKPGGGMPDNVNARAALVSGPPGIGKTTACRLLGALEGRYEVLEFNASDARSAKTIQRMAEGLSDNRMLTFGGSSGSTAVPDGPKLAKRSLIIMDEVDGMGAGDRGGNAALIKMIKKTKNPIICICNDHSSPKVRSLAFSCYDVRFSRPSKTIIAQRVAEIAAAEGLSVEPNALEELVASCGNDIRHTLNELQVLSKSPQFGQGSEISFTDMQEVLKRSSKDGAIMMNPFEACKQLLTSSLVKRMSINECLDRFFVDFNLMHLMVHENYLGAVAKRPVDMELLDDCARSAELIACSDLFNESIRQGQNWGLLGSMGFLGCVYPCKLSNGFVAFPEFPKYLGNYSKQSRARRLSLELHAHLRLQSRVRRREMICSGYAQVLQRRLLLPLELEDIDGAVAVLDAYGLQREHLSEHLNELSQHLGCEDEFKLLDPKVKAAMTRELNQGVHVVRVVLPRSKRKRDSVPEGDGLEADEEVDAVRPDENEEAEAKKVDDTSAVEVGGLLRRAKPLRVAAAKRRAASVIESASRCAASAKGSRQVKATDAKVLAKVRVEAEKNGNRRGPANEKVLPKAPEPRQKALGVATAKPSAKAQVKVSGKVAPKVASKGKTKPKSKAEGRTTAPISKKAKR